MFPLCSSIIAAHSSDRHILVFENDAELFNGLLEPNQTPTTDSKSLAFATTCNGMDFDDDPPIETSHYLTYVSKIFLCFPLNNFNCCIIIYCYIL